MQTLGYNRDKNQRWAKGKKLWQVYQEQRRTTESLALLPIRYYKGFGATLSRDCTLDLQAEEKLNEERDVEYAGPTKNQGPLETQLNPKRELNTGEGA